MWKIWSTDRKISYPADLNKFCARNNSVAKTIEPSVLILCIRLSFSADGGQQDGSSFLESEVLEGNFLECQSLFSFRWLLISFLSWQYTADTTSSTWCTTRTNADGSLLRFDTSTNSATECFRNFTQTPSIHSCACWLKVRNLSGIGYSHWTSINHNQAWPQE